MSFRKSDGTHTTIKPEARVFANDAQALYRLARAGAGIAIVPDFLAQEDEGRGAISHVLPDWGLQAITVFAVWPSNAPRHGLIHLALDALAQTQP